jgi:hypothetical protein
MNALSFPGAVANWRRVSGRRTNRRTTGAPRARRRGTRLLLILLLGGMMWGAPSGWSVFRQYVYSTPTSQ